EDVPGPAVGSRATQTQAAPLPHRERVRAVVLTDDLAALVDDLAGRLAQSFGEPARGVTAGDEADVVAVRLVGDGQAAALRLDAHLRLRRVTEREHRVRQLFLGQHAEDVRLVLA